MAENGPSLERMKDVVQRFLERLDAGRFEELRPLLSEKLTYQTIGRPPIVGASELVRFYQQTRTAGMGSHDVLDVIAEGAHVAVVLRMRAVLKDGRTTEFGAVDLFSFEGDTISGIRTFTDVPPAPSELTALRKEPSG